MALSKSCDSYFHYPTYPQYIHKSPQIDDFQQFFEANKNIYHEVVEKDNILSKPRIDKEVT